MMEFSEAGELAAEMALEETELDSPSWFRGVALTTLILSVFTAAAALLAGMTAHEILVDRTEEILDASAAQSDRISAEVLASKHEVLLGLGLPVDPQEVAQVEAFEAESERLEGAAEFEEVVSTETGSIHLVAALAATVFAVSIAVTGLAAVVHRKWLWYVGTGLGTLALIPFASAAISFFA